MATKIKKILPDIEFLSLLKRSERESYLKKAKMVHIKLYKTFIANIYYLEHMYIDRHFKQ